MHKSKLMRFSSSLTPLALPWLLLVHCGTEKNGDTNCEPGEPGCVASGGSGPSGAGSTSTGGTVSTGGTSATGGTTATGGMTANGGTSATGGTTTTGGTTAAGGMGATGGTTVANGGSVSTGGSNATGGTVSNGGTNATGGTTSTGGMAGTGATNAGSSGGGSGPIADQNGIPLAKPGDMKTVSREYLNLGEMRLIVNKWGSDELNCNTDMSVFVNNDRSVGWTFNRQMCGGGGAKPDYPEIEFGVHPFGAGNVLETTPPFSSTTLLPLQIKDLMSASAQIENFSLQLQSAVSWNISFEFWLSERNPLTDPNPGVHAELIVFWGWQNGRWPCDKSGDVSSAGKTYHLCHQDDQWADGKWRYFQFWDRGGPNMNFSGTFDVKPFLEWLVNNYGYSRDLWVTRFEIGSEIDDHTSGTGTVRNVTFEVNGATRAIQLGQ